MLVVPADARFLHVLRTLTAGVAAMLDITYDTLDDQRIAITEAANFLLSRAPATSSLTLRIWPDVEKLVVTLEADGVLAIQGDDPADGFSWSIMEALADRVEQTASGERGRITMTWTTLSHHPA
jgi:anti-sigma regulatory factor (Ser/Thr protein kinase)